MNRVLKQQLTILSLKVVLFSTTCSVMIQMFSKFDFYLEILLLNITAVASSKTDNYTIAWMNLSGMQFIKYKYWLAYFCPEGLI